MDFFETVEKRRSVRKYTAKKVPEGVIRNALKAALIAPNSSNMQPWEFYWVKSPDKKSDLVKACFSQPAAATAQELIVCTARIDTWKRNQKLMLESLAKVPNAPKAVLTYYKKLVPMIYRHGPFGIFGLFKFILFTVMGFFRPTPRKPNFKSEVFEMVVKTTALACENFMLAITAQGFGTCPMEGFDECRVKKILNLKCNSRVVMIISVGEADPQGIYGPRIRFDDKLFLFEV